MPDPMTDDFTTPTDDNRAAADELLADAVAIDTTPLLVKLLTPWRRYSRCTANMLAAAQVCATLAVADELHSLVNLLDGERTCLFCGRGEEAAPLMRTHRSFEPFGPGLAHEECEASAYSDTYAGASLDFVVARSDDPDDVDTDEPAGWFGRNEADELADHVAKSAIVHRVPAATGEHHHRHLADRLAGMEEVAAQRRRAAAQPGGSRVVLVLDEVQSYLSHPTYGPEALRRLTDLAATGREVDVWVTAPASALGRDVPAVLRDNLDATRQLLLGDIDEEARS